MFYKTYHATPMGTATMASDGAGLTGLWLEGQSNYERTVRGKLVEKADLSVFDDTKKWLDDYFSGKKPEVSDLALSLKGTEFRMMVWDLLIKIPYGELTTYGGIAKTVAHQMGRKTMSAQAVGGAVGNNPISIIVPCHRVVGTNGSLTGYAGGIDKKIKLLEHEGVDMSRLYVPQKGTAL
ncbi:MAG: methylated-DNA--[protein]-cysteine S-methyltransferase [Firmicutes bacterium]|nr:methylated-DNA--[protein]-cysteine S-methyltransferase [Bacillota bacterium]